VPVLFDRRQVAFIVDQLPMIVLQGLPDSYGLPLIQLDEGGQIGPCSGWVLVAHPTMCVVDGPGDSGLLLPVFAGAETPDAVAQHDRWLSAVTIYGGAVLVAGDSEVTSMADVATRSGLRGGFLPAT
jgi:hypothetical protein